MRKTTSRSWHDSLGMRIMSRRNCDISARYDCAFLRISEKSTMTYLLNEWNDAMQVLRLRLASALKAPPVLHRIKPFLNCVFEKNSDLLAHFLLTCNYIFAFSTTFMQLRCIYTHHSIVAFDSSMANICEYKCDKSALYRSVSELNSKISILSKFY